MARRALLVVDVQRDFCEGGSLAVAGGSAVAAGVSALLEGPADRPDRHPYDLVVATRDWHIDPGAHFAPDDEDPDFVDTWPAHCVAGTPGADWHPELHLPSATVVITKGEHAAAFSGFEGHSENGVPLTDFLRERGIEALDVVGIATTYCVKATALDGVRDGFEVRVLTSLVADVDPTVTPETLDALRRAGVATVGAV